MVWQTVSVVREVKQEVMNKLFLKYFFSEKGKELN